MSLTYKTPVLRRLAWTALAVQFSSFMLAWEMAKPFYTVEYLPAQREAIDVLLALWWPFLLVFAIWNPWAGRFRFRFLAVIASLSIYIFCTLLFSLISPVFDCQFVETVPTGRRYECTYHGSDRGVFEQHEGRIEFIFIENLY